MGTSSARSTSRRLPGWLLSPPRPPTVRRHLRPSQTTRQRPASPRLEGESASGPTETAPGTSDSGGKVDRDSGARVDEDGALLATPECGPPDALDDDVTSASTASDDSLRSWVDERRQTLMWKLAKRVYEQRRSEQQKATAAQKILDANRAAPSVDSLVRARRVLLITWTVSLILLAIGALSYWLEPGPLDEWLTSQRWQSVGTWLAVILAIFLYGGHQYYRAARSYEWAVQQRLHNLRTASDEFVAASQQETRWSLMYTGVLDWAKSSPSCCTDPGRFRRFNSLHWMHRLASPPRSRWPSLTATRPIRRQTWSPRPWRRCVIVGGCGKSLIELRRAAASMTLPTARPPETSPPTSIWVCVEADPGTELLGVVTADEGRAAAGQEVYDRIHDLVARNEVRVPPLSVTRIGGYASGEVHDDRSFIASIREDPGSFSGDVFSAAALVASRHVVRHHVLTLPAGIQAEPAENLTLRPSDSFISTRVDVSGTLAPKGLGSVRSGWRSGRSLTRGHDGLQLTIQFRCRERTPPCSRSSDRRGYTGRLCAMTRYMPPSGDTAFRHLAWATHDADRVSVLECRHAVASSSRRRYGGRATRDVLSADRASNARRCAASSRLGSGCQRLMTQDRWSSFIPSGRSTTARSNSVRHTLSDSRSSGRSPPPAATFRRTACTVMSVDPSSRYSRSTGSREVRRQNAAALPLVSLFHTPSEVITAQRCQRYGTRSGSASAGLKARPWTRRTCLSVRPPAPPRPTSA